MTSFEYLLLFVVIVLGVAVNDLAISLHRLLGPRPVRWDALAPAAALVAFLKIVSQWWTWYDGAQVANGLTFELFLGILAGSVLLSLMAASALPDQKPPGEVIDLEAHYAAISRQYWVLFLLHWIVARGMSVLAEMSVTGGQIDFAKPTYLVPLVVFSLIVIRKRWWHGLSLAGLTVFYVTQLLGQTLG